MKTTLRPPYRQTLGLSLISAKPSLFLFLPPPTYNIYFPATGKTFPFTDNAFIYVYGVGYFTNIITFKMEYSNLRPHQPPSSIPAPTLSLLPRSLILFLQTNENALYFTHLINEDVMRHDECFIGNIQTMQNNKNVACLR